MVDFDDLLAPLGPLSGALCNSRNLMMSARLYSPQKQLLSDALEALATMESLFRPRLQNFATWSPTLKEKQVIRSASRKLYANNDLEAVFYEAGGIIGIVALILVFRENEQILTRWESIKTREMRRWLAYNVSYLFSGQQNPWVDNWQVYCEELPPMSDGHRLDYLGLHPGRRRKAAEVARSSSPAVLPLLPMPQKRKAAIPNSSLRNDSPPHPLSLSSLLSPEDPCDTFAKLDPDARILVEIIIFSVETDFSQCMFSRATKPLGFWNSGEIENVPAFGIPEVLCNTELLTSSFARLRARGIMEPKTFDTFAINSAVREYVVDRMPPSDRMAMKLIAWRFALHTFPHDPDTEMNVVL